jgi:hypothetical protein
MRRPWLKFYPNDWRGEPRLRMCSLAARGLWIDLMSYMHEGEPYGHLTINGAAPNMAALVSLIGRPSKEVEKALAELEAQCVFSRTDRGVIFSRRMVRDEQRAIADRDNGRLGGNPKLATSRRREVNPLDKGPDKTQTPDARSQSLDKEQGGGSARARPLVSPEATKLADELAEICGHGTDPKAFPPAWHGAPMRVQTWLDSGWHPEIIAAAVREAVAKKRDGPVENVAYFEKPIARAIARQSAPLPVEKPLEQQEVPYAAGKSQSPLIAAADRLVGRLRSLDAGAPQGQLPIARQVG